MRGTGEGQWEAGMDGSPNWPTGESSLGTGVGTPGFIVAQLDGKSLFYYLLVN